MKTFCKLTMQSPAASYVPLPRFLLQDEALRDISNDAKVLYALLLDRASISRQNGYVEPDGTIRLYFTLEQAQTTLHRNRQSATRIFRELEYSGLIIRRKQGLGKPALITLNYQRTQNSSQRRAKMHKLDPIERLPDGTLFRLTPGQLRSVRGLTKRCCNFLDGDCLLLDGVCPQFISRSLICRWFRRAVLPQQPKLEQAILSPKKLRRCEVCGTGILARSGRTKYCPACAAAVHRQQKAKSARKRRSGVDNWGRKALEWQALPHRRRHIAIRFPLRHRN